MFVSVFAGLFMLIMVGVLLSISMGIYNGLSILKKQLERSWLNLDLLFKKRNEFIHNLLEIVDPYAKNERAILNKLKEATDKYSQAKHLTDKIKVTNEITNALKSILAIGEAYADLRSSADFLSVQKQIVLLEDQLSKRGDLFNETIRILNTRLDQFPDMFFATLLGCSELAYLKVEGDERLLSFEYKTAA